MNGACFGFLVYKDHGAVHRDEPLDGCFVLRPENDQAARRALMAYAAATADERLRDDLRAWVARLDAKA